MKRIRSPFFFVEHTGYCIGRRRHCKSRVGIQHWVTKDDAMKWFQVKYQGVVHHKYSVIIKLICIFFPVHWVHGSASDINALCVGPNFATLEGDFLIILRDILQSRLEISDNHCVKTAKVPLIHFKFNGISACAICDGASTLFKGQVLAVVGGGDTATEKALYLTKYTRHVHLLVRRNQLRASKDMQDRNGGLFFTGDGSGKLKMWK